MEDKLDAISRGEHEYVKTLKEFYGPFLKEVKEKSKSSEKITNLGPVDEKFKCPLCGSPMIWKLGRGGKFMSCERFPDCEGARTAEGLELKKEDDSPLGMHPESNLPIFVKSGRFGPYVQLGKNVDEKGKKVKPKMASIPKEKDPTTVTVNDAVKYLSIPKVLGQHPESGKDITAGVGRFGPYIVHDGDFRSLKTDNVYEIKLDRALEILKEPKKPRGFAKKKKAE
jgi:DNA topoisomerase-1